MENSELMRWFGLGGAAGAFLSVIGIGFQIVRNAMKHTVNDA